MFSQGVGDGPCDSDELVLKCGSINMALKVIGDKWTGFIVRELIIGPRRFSELEQNLGIGPRTLSQRLDTLEEHHIITKKQFAESPPRVEYSLTKKGEDLLPVLQTMAEWSEKYA
ncbi:MAG TPA: helix-turn-helix domain-containing protein [Patescibacteria group bacterium]|nr:helix-turn-helix domain-containing protein [Patescibacteria group bacterium]